MMGFSFVTLVGTLTSRIQTLAKCQSSLSPDTSCIHIAPQEGLNVALASTNRSTSRRDTFVADELVSDGSSANIKTADILSLLKCFDAGERVRIESGPELITITQIDGTGRSQATFDLFAMQLEFPALFDIPKDIRKFELEKTAFCSALASVVSSVKHNADAGALSGVLLRITEAAVTLVATDGSRLSLAKLDGIEGVEESIDIVLPEDCCEQVLAFKGERLTLAVQGNQSAIYFLGENTVLMSFAVAGAFVNFAMLIKKFTPHTNWDVRRADLVSALKSAMLCSDDGKVALTFERKRGIISVEGASTSRKMKGKRVIEGVAQVVIPDELRDVEVIFMNGKFIKDALDNLRDDRIKVSGSVPADNPNSQSAQLMSPLIFTSAGEIYSKHLIMAIRPAAAPAKREKE